MLQLLIRLIPDFLTAQVCCKDCFTVRDRRDLLDAEAYCPECEERLCVYCGCVALRACVVEGRRCSWSVLIPELCSACVTKLSERLYNEACAGRQEVSFAE